MGDRVKMCDKCNRLWGGGTPGIDEIDNLKNCGGHFIDTGIDFHEHLIIENISKDREFFLAMAKLKKDDIIEYNAKMSQFKKQYDEMIAERNKPKCPKCGSKNITTGERGFSFVTGFIGAGKTVNRCGDCGYKWKPKK